MKALPALLCLSLCLAGQYVRAGDATIAKPAEPTTKTVIVNVPGPGGGAGAQHRVVIIHDGDATAADSAVQPVAPVPPLPPVPPLAPIIIDLQAAGQAPSDAATGAFVGLELGMPGAMVKGAPYSADAVDERIQTLADGNRIVNKRVTRLYRDGQGRTRQDLLAADGRVRTIHIVDPVAGVHYVLDPRTKIATRLPLPRLPNQPQVTVADGGSVRVQASSIVSRTVGNDTYVEVGGEAGGDCKTLSKKEIDGIKVEGCVKLSTIPAGRVGNEKPIELSNERWYSPELKLVLATTARDPRTGEARYRLEKMSRTEPDASLFKVPAEYKLNDVAARVHRLPAQPLPPKAP